MACMVDHTFSVLGSDCGFYKAGSRWAEPDIVHAAEYMKKLYSNEIYREDLAQKAKSHAEAHFSPDRAAALMQKRISEIYETKGNE